MSEFDVFYFIVFVVLGLLTGSFANVVIFRLPQDKSVVSPRSACPKCQTLIPLYHNIPVMSWLLLKGKCANCKAAISIRYPLVEFLMGLLFGLVYLKHGLTFFSFELLILFWGLVTVSFIDYDHYIIPDKISYPGMLLGLLGSFLNPERSFLDSLLGLILGGGFLWAIAVIYYKIKKEEGMGGGDIKLLAWIGSVLGWTPIAFVILVSSLLGSIVGVFLIYKNKDTLKKVIPFGPFIATAAILYVFWGQQITNWYLSIFFPWGF